MAEQMFRMASSPGDHISHTAERLCEAAQEHGAATAEFNGIELIARQGTTPDEVVASYDVQTAERRAAYVKSPEGIEAARQSALRLAEAQATHDALVQRLPTLDMSDQHAVLDWICEMQEPSDHVGVNVARPEIVERFESAGYRANVHTGKDYRKGDRDNTFRYLVGQALSGIKDGPAIHPIIHKFADEWRNQFPRDVA